MTYILVFWTVVGYAGTKHSTYTKLDWRPIGEFTSEASCVEAARVLAIDTTKFRCLKK